MPNNLASVAALSFTSQDPRHPSGVRYDVLPVRAQLTASYTKVFTNNLSSGKCIMDCVRVTNRAVAARTFSMCIVSPAQAAPWNSAADAIADNIGVSLEASETFTTVTKEDPIYLDSGDEVWMKASAADSLTVNISMRVEQ